MIGEDLRQFANSLRSGHLKEWKANSIAITVKNDMPNIIQDKDRLLSYVCNCLLMEGFLEDDCVDITNWIQVNWK